MPRHATQRSEHGFHPLRWIAVLGAVLALTGAAVHQSKAAGPHDETPATARPAMVTEPMVTLDQNARRQPRASSSAPQAHAGVPRRLALPALGVSAPVVPISSDQGVLTPPDDPQTLGWWSQGAQPGARRGGALITGHTVHTGGGALDDLEQLKPGAAVRVGTDHGALDYAVTRVTVYPKRTLAADAAEIFSQSVPGRLVLVTCEDWNGHDYESNVVVVAEPRG